MIITTTAIMLVINSNNNMKNNNNNNYKYNIGKSAVEKNERGKAQKTSTHTHTQKASQEFSKFWCI